MLMETAQNGKQKALEAFKSADNAVAVMTAEESQAAYNRRAEIYDKQSVDLGLEVPRHAALVCLKYIENAKSSSVLDVGGGTGAVAFHLRKTGDFKGAIDIMDANMEMLYVASKKDLAFRTITCHWIEEELLLPSNSYDAVTCLESLYPNHLSPQSVKGMLKVVKHGGYLIFNLRNRHAGVDAYLAQLQQIVDELIRNQEAELAEVEEVVHLKNVDNLQTKLYVYRKL